MEKSKTTQEVMVINCGRKPKIPRGMEIKEHHGKGVINFNLNKLRAENIRDRCKLNESFLSLEEAVRRFHRNRKNLPADANVLDAINKRLDQIPKRFNRPGTYLLFLGTIYLKKSGQLCVRALNYAQNGWYETILLNSDRFAGSDFVVYI
jgi:hypothetical protein